MTGATLIMDTPREAVLVPAVKRKELSIPLKLNASQNPSQIYWLFLKFTGFSKSTAKTVLSATREIGSQQMIQALT